MVLPISTRLVQSRFSLSKLLLLLLMLLQAGAATAQSTAANNTSTRTNADSLRQIAREDTTYALQRLFHESRRRYAIQAVMRGVGLGYFATFSVLKVFKQEGNTEQKIVNVSVIAISGYLFTRSVIGLYRYRAGREKKLLAALEQGQPIPAKIRKTFKPGYFDTPTTSN